MTWSNLVLIHLDYLGYKVNIYKGKGDALESGNNRGLKLLDHGMKVVERVLERLIRERVNIN